MKYFWRIKRSIRFFWQRLTRGFDDSDLWSLDYTILKFIYPRLKEFRSWGKSVPFHPTELDEDGHPRGMTTEEWNNILDEILKGFEIYLESNVWLPNSEEDLQIEKSMDLFRKWLFHLWT